METAVPCCASCSCEQEDLPLPQLFLCKSCGTEQKASLLAGGAEEATRP